MIIFFDKRNGKIFSTVDGRVHDKLQEKSSVDCGIGEENIGKIIIGWTEMDGRKVEHNMDEFKLLQKFEDNTSVSPYDYKVIEGKIIKK